jgi:ribonuclease J
MDEFQNKLRIIPLGGVEEIGINCTVFEYNGKVVVVDVGLGFPDDDMYGVDYVVPNVGYLEKRHKDIEGIVITHGHLDHIGGLPYLLPRLGFPPIYATPFTVELIRAKLTDFGMENKVQMHKIDTKSVLRSGDFELQFFAVNHSIPQCVGLYLKTPTAKIVHTGDFKFDNSPVNEPVADYAKIARIGEEGVDLLMSDSTNSLKRGYPISESAVAAKLEQIIKNANGRVIVGAFSGLIGRLYQLIKIGESYDRKVAIAGYGMNQSLRIAQEIGYISPKPGVIVPIQKINRYHPNKQLILTTGAQGEENAALYRMATEGYKDMNIRPGDLIILSAGTIPGNHLAVQQLTDAISDKGGTVVQSEDMDFFTSGHGYQEDQKLMLNLVKPKFFMPVHGYQYFLKEHARTATQVGIKESNIIIPKRGSVIAGDTKSGFKQVDIVKAQPLLVSGLGVGDIGTAVLAERKQLGNYGVVTILMNLEQQSKKLIGDIFMQSRGFVFVKASADLFDELKAMLRHRLENGRLNRNDIIEFREHLTKDISSFLMKETGREPVIMLITNFIKSIPGPREHKPRVARPSHPASSKAPAAQFDTKTSATVDEPDQTGNLSEPPSAEAPSF